MKRHIGRSKGQRCPSGKVRFRDHLSAVQAATNIAVVSTRETVPVRAYRCPHCKGWHLTSQGGR